MIIQNWKKMLGVFAAAITITATSMVASLDVLAAPISYSEDDSVSAQIEAAYGALPAAIQNSFEKNGWNIMILNGNSMDQAYGGGQMGAKGYIIEGVTVYKQKVIALNSNKQYALDALNHEMGHYFDYTMGGQVGFLSEKPDFMTIYQVEAKNSGLGEYVTSNVLEYYAQAFKMIRENPEALQTKAPQTYLYVTTALQSFEAAN